MYQMFAVGSKSGLQVGQAALSMESVTLCAASVQSKSLIFIVVKWCICIFKGKLAPEYTPPLTHSWEAPAWHNPELNKQLRKYNLNKRAKWCFLKLFLIFLNI